MAFKITVEIYLSEIELSLVCEHKINVPKVCIEAIKEELSNHNSMKYALNGISTANLRDRLKEARAEIAKLRLQKMNTLVTIPLNRH